MTLRRLIFLALFALSSSLLPMAPLAYAQQQGDHGTVQAFLDGQPGVLKSFREGDLTAAMLIESQADYYGLSPRLYLALLEATGALLSNPAPAATTLAQPFGSGGPNSFTAQIEWASRELRAGLGPYDQPPTLQFTDGTTLTLTLQQAPEGVSVQRFLAHGRSYNDWRQVVERFALSFTNYFGNQLPLVGVASPPPGNGFLLQPWPAGVRMQHLAYFDHAFPTVDSGEDGNSEVVTYLGGGGVQYDGHDGHDYVFLDQPIGTPILAAAPGMAYARTVRGNGVVIQHDGGYETVYWHLDQFAPIFNGRINSDQGIPVAAGDVLGTSGRTGFVYGTPHLHFEVRLHGLQVDPYSWYGPGADPCVAYAGCLASHWLWHDSLRGTYDFTPPDISSVPDTIPPLATITAQPRAGLRFLARFEGNVLQQVGAGFASTEGALEFPPARDGSGVLVPPGSGLSYQTESNLNIDAGTLAFWALLPAEYPANDSGRNYLFASSATPDGTDAGTYTGTIALLRDNSSGAQWNFWTASREGVADELRVADSLSPGLHHFAVTWRRDDGSKTLYIDGMPVGKHSGVALPDGFGNRIELGRFANGAGHSGAIIDELAVFDRALQDQEIKALFEQQGQLPANESLLHQPNLIIDVNALDNNGGIVAVQLGLDGSWEAPQPYYDSYRWRLPARNGPMTIGARFTDRAGNTTIVSTTLTIETNGIVYLPVVAADIFPQSPRSPERLANSRRSSFLPLVQR